ncbi:EMYY motif lipoprotein [Staphylococcus sp. NRL 16/872]|uniref:EMYY motif lipoprotein n=1 Tax=Staphylococcus sp. NRL 16/872 TaxID=2930131 RepID=UPI001FB3EDEC|nr:MULTISPECIES: EMYY motif lipoprotein [unclassified Staphylococcus]MCJ1656913.1 EMYY motif lipoprotein [Staphylococcus sp. NRL 21/187]MCJ1662656.1 EMYY motif lipoprotein [Staphylococcus sp. NRL 18/288]MCJ1668763.1 EMYY motif lipoprotein [Staphylococcus sp. NRL 19/737]WEN68978.1 EMYY motif lipoprotein [Staphylococcus sp. NRL 16/872]
MKKIAILSMIVVCSLILSSCGVQHNSNLKSFSQHLDKVENKKKDVETVMDKIHLKKLNELSKTDTTDKNKKEFKALQKDINNHLIPTFKNYEKAAKQLPAKNSETKDLKQKYLKNVSQERQKMDDIKAFVDLCNQSISANENILDYTKLFEKNRSQVETAIQKANNQDDANQLTSKIEDNNKQLQQTAQKYLENGKFDSTKAIKSHMKPLIEKQITELNRTNITDTNVNDARKNAIEMYYNLLNYYDTREKTIKIEKKLSKINVEKLPKTGKELNKQNNDFAKDFKRVKEK